MNTAVAVAGQPCAAVRSGPDIAFIVAVLGPVVDVAMHLVEAPRVGPELVDRQRLVSALPASCLPGRAVSVIRVCDRDGCAPPKRLTRAGPSDIFALGFGQ